LVGAVLLVAGAGYAPELLAWPYSAERGATTVYSERPITRWTEAALARADGLLAASPINEPNVRRRIFLSDGGWRWKLLAVRSPGSFGFRLPFSSVLVFNRSDPEADRIYNGRAIGGTRTLSGTIAHETTHLLTARHIGEIRMGLLPQWKREGYADHIARESSLSPAEHEALKRSGRSHPALPYYEGRLRVAAFLKQNGGDVDRLFAE
jgi:hypothetical protein